MLPEETSEKKPRDAKLTSGLSAHIQKVWNRNFEDFKPVRQKMLKVMLRINGQYDAEKMAAIKAFKGSSAYFRSAESKARAAESWIKDIYRGDKDLPWAIEPTALSDLPQDVLDRIKAETKQQVASAEAQIVSKSLPVDPVAVAELLQQYYEEKLEEEKKKVEKVAKERCQKAAEYIRDQNQEGGWDNAFSDFLYYFTRFSFGVIKGPVLKKVKKQVWQYNPTLNEYEISTVEDLAIDVYCVSPFNFFPSKGMCDINDGDVIEVHELSRQSLVDLIGVPGYDSERIRVVLNEFDKGDLKSRWFNIDDETEVKKAITANTHKDRATPIDNTGKTILAQEFYGSVPGHMLIDWGVDAKLDRERQYQVNCWKIGQHVIKAVVNPDPLGRKPYHVSSWAKNPAWIVGEGMLEFAGPVEDAMNAIVRALINNIGIASGPMCEIDKERVDEHSGIYPWRQFLSTSRQMRESGPAVRYYQPNMHANELINAWMFFSKVLDEMTVPSYVQGAGQTGVTAGTATVFTQLLAAASRSIKAVVANIDKDIIAPYIQMCYDYNMKFGQDPSIKGDARVVAKGVIGLLALEQQSQRKVEYLQVAMTPVLSQILGAKNLGAIAAQIAKANNIELPDMGRLSDTESIEATIQQMLMAQSGAESDPIQQNGQVARGGGAPTTPQGTLPDGSKAGVANP